MDPAPEISKSYFAETEFSRVPQRQFHDPPLAEHQDNVPPPKLGRVKKKLVRLDLLAFTFAQPNYRKQSTETTTRNGYCHAVQSAPSRTSGGMER